MNYFLNFSLKVHHTNIQINFTSDSDQKVKKSTILLMNYNYCPSYRFIYICVVISRAIVIIPLSIKS